MKTYGSTPLSDGFSMPAEFEPHDGTVMIFPERPGSWPYGAADAQRVFAQIASIISKSEKVYMLASRRTYDAARAVLPPEVEVLEIDSDDAWARDTAPTFVTNGIGAVRGVNWRFNAWGGEYDGLYAKWDKDDALAKEFCGRTGYDIYDASPFVLEGGSIHTDGEGTLITTEACLLSPGRNPGLGRGQIEERLREYLGVKKIIWLPHGIWRDETNEHVDNICAPIRPGEVVLAWTDDIADPQYEYSKSCLDVLERETDAAGRKITVHKLPIPSHPVCVTDDDLNGYIFEDGEDVRKEGERLAASYVNFYFANSLLLLPQFGGENAESDRLAFEIMSRLCPEREVVPVYARPIILGGGNIHCITQQIPKGVKKA